MKTLVPKRIRHSVLALASGGLLLAPAPAGAQHAHTASMASMGAASPGTVSARTREQIAVVEKAVSALKTLDSAGAEGFAPTLGMLPTMGTHEVNQDRILDSVDLLKPDVLMFSSVGGEQRLVGVAYGFIGQVADAPDLFDGTQDTWHEHPEFAPPGQSLVMLHVWFVPSPDGPFAGHNPWLGYWAAGVEPPADSVLSTPASASRARRLGLALSETVEPLPVALAQMGTGGLEMVPGVAERRDSIRAIIPRLNAARRAADDAQWNREADAAISAWEQIRDAYLGAIPAPMAGQRDQLAEFYREMETGQHAH
jgi:hypothetical protein